ncbi:hypothetical protein CO613_06895 [Lysobacteraceae bacterium NML07-0707]|nr:hypothetical protein CO613_06895 [Xanthomonadaceae bacterium NML07-0707]
MRLLFWFLACCAFPAALSANADELTVYRCVNDKGQLTLRDTPCLASEKQKIRAMLRPSKSPPRPMPQTAAPPPATAPVTQTVVTYMPLRPIYQCTAPDGSRYHSQTPQGKLRWQPLWVELPDYQTYPPVRIANNHASVRYQSRHGHVRIDSGRQVLGTADIRMSHEYPLAGIGTWVHDPCVALTQAETCMHFDERRAYIRRRYPHAMPSERRELERESTLIEQQSQQCNR